MRSATNSKQRPKRRLEGNGVRRLEVAEKVAPANAQSFGNPQQSMEADPLLAAFDFTHINRVQLGLFRQPLLAHARLGTVLADGGTKNSELLSLSRHSLERKQEETESNTPNMGVFFVLASMGELEKLGAMGAGEFQTCRV
jgi:hypothetical protein